MKNESSSIIHRCFILKISKQKTALLLLLVAVAVSAVFLLLPDTQETPEGFLGNWCCPEQNLRLIIEADQLTINAFCFPYELCSPIQASPDREHPQGFVIAAGSMGTLPGLLFLEEDRLFIEIDGNTRVFVRTEIQGHLTPAKGLFHRLPRWWEAIYSVFALYPATLFFQGHLHG